MDVFLDDAVPPAAARLFVILARRFSAGFYGRRETLAKWGKVSKATVDTYVAKLARRGYLVVTRRTGQPGIIRPVPEAVERSGIVTNLDAASKSNLDATSKSPYKEHDYLTKPCYRQPGDIAVCNPDGFAALRAIGIRDQEAADLSGRWPTKKIRAAIRYAEQKAEQNPAGFVVAAIRDGFRIPSWAFAGLGDHNILYETRSPAGPQTTICSIPPDPRVRSAGENPADPNAWDLAVSRSDRETWSGFLDQIRRKVQPATYDAWFRETILEGVEDGVLSIGTRDEATADWIGEHYAWLVQDVADDLFGERVAVQVHAVGKADTGENRRS